MTWKEAQKLKSGFYIVRCKEDFSDTVATHMIEKRYEYWIYYGTVFLGLPELVLSIHPEPIDLNKDFEPIN